MKHTRSPHAPKSLRAAAPAALAFFVCLALTGCSVFRREVTPVAFDHGYSAWAATLAQAVTPEGVHYDRLAGDSSNLLQTLEQFAATGFEDYARFNRDERLSALINAHNALGMKRGLERWNSGPLGWMARLLTPDPELEFAGRGWSAKDLRREIMSDQFDEARAAFALNCGERGCPPLAAVPYTPANLDAALERQTRLFMNNPDYNRFDAERRIFIASPRLKENSRCIERQYTSLHSFIRRFSAPELRAEMEKYPPRIVYGRKDHRLNAAAAISGDA